MDAKGIFIKKDGIGNISKCQCGLVHINIKGISLHFDEFAFLQFSRMVQEASSKLMDAALSILTDNNDKR